MCPHVIPKQQGKLLWPTSCAAHVNMGSAFARRFTKIPLRQFWVIGSKNKSKAFDRKPKCVEGLEGSDGYLDINDWLGGQAGY